MLFSEKCHMNFGLVAEEMLTTYIEHAVLQ